MVKLTWRVVTDGAHEVVIGMAHRGRLNVLAHTVGRPYESILREFEGERVYEAVVADPEGAPVTQAQVTHPVRWEWPLNQPVGSVVIRCGDKTLAEITSIQTAF